MNPFLAITKALSDEGRVRALVALRGGELCLCQIIDMLELAPSTVSKHMSILWQAGLVTRRKAGRWHYYRLASSPTTVRRAVRWALDSLQDEKIVVKDAKHLQYKRATSLRKSWCDQ